MNEELNCLIALNQLLNKLEWDQELKNKITKEKIDLLNESVDFLATFIFATRSLKEENDEN